MQLPGPLFFRSTLTASALVALLWPGPLAAQGDGDLPPVALESLGEGLEGPVALTHAGDGLGRLFVTLQGGRVLIYDGARFLDEPFLDLSAIVSRGSERGLLSIAFHPDYAANGRFYVYYTDLAGDVTVARYRVSGDPDRADPASGEVLLSVPHRDFPNHNGGQLQFGPDGYLYAATGDGGGAGDPGDNAQDLGSLLGKLLRIDVDAAAPGLAYALPPDNPFLGDAAARDEIWAYGLRNPWRFSFDRETGDLWLADVGQNLFEEVNLQPASSAGGENYGWRLMEADACFDPPSACDDGSLTLPVLVYDHSDGSCSVTGGYRYRGTAIQGLAGVYLFSDFCSGRLWGAVEQDDGSWQRRTLIDSTGLAVTAFGEDELGELYLVGLGDGGGRLLRVVPGADLDRVVTRPRAVNFGNVDLGDRSRLKSVKVVNRGDAPVVLGEVFLGGGDAADFQVPGGRDGCSGATLDPRERCRLRVRFTPTEEGARRALLVVPAGSGELSVDLRGRGR